MQYFKKSFLIVGSCLGMFFLFSTSAILAQNNPDDMLGVWLVQKKDGKVELFKQGNKYFGKITWLSEPTEKDGKPKIDSNNPDASKRTQPIMGLVVVKNLIWKGKGEWEDGKVYDPDNGKTYSASVKLKDKNTLEFTGFIGFSFIGRTEIWTRVR